MPRLALRGGEIVARYDKRELPNYGVFDEERTFAPGRRPLAIETPAARSPVTICEDVWLPGRRAEAAGAAGATVVAQHLGVAVPPGQGRSRARRCCARGPATALCFVAYCNLVGGQDELVFDGRSVVIDPDGEVLARAATFAEELLVCDIDPTPGDGGAAARLAAAPRPPRSRRAAARAGRMLAAGGRSRGRRAARSRRRRPAATQSCGPRCGSASRDYVARTASAGS